MKALSTFQDRRQHGEDGRVRSSAATILTGFHWQLWAMSHPSLAMNTEACVARLLVGLVIDRGHVPRLQGHRQGDDLNQHTSTANHRRL